MFDWSSTIMHMHGYRQRANAIWRRKVFNLLNSWKIIWFYIFFNDIIMLYRINNLFTRFDIFAWELGNPAQKLNLVEFRRKFQVSPNQSNLGFDKKSSTSCEMFDTKWFQEDNIIRIPCFRINEEKHTHTKETFVGKFFINSVSR